MFSQKTEESDPGHSIEDLIRKRDVGGRDSKIEMLEEGRRYLYYLSTATVMLYANTGKHCWYKQSVVVYKNKNELESSPVGCRCNLKPHMLVRRITASWGSLILKIWATLRGTRMPLILKI